MKMKTIIIALALSVLLGVVTEAQIRSHIDFKLADIELENKMPRKGDLILFRIFVEKLGMGNAEKVNLVCKLRHYQVVDLDIDFTKRNKIVHVYQWKALSGKQTFKCAIDPKDNFLETNEDNNESSLAFDVALPKLPSVLDKSFILSSVPTSSIGHRARGRNNKLTYPPDLYPLDLYLDEARRQIYINLQNRGGAFNLDWNYKITWSGIQGGEGKCDGVRKGFVNSYANIRISCPLPAGFFTRFHTKRIQFKIILDSGNIIKEYNEINNIFYKMIKIISKQGRKIRLNTGEAYK